MQFLIRNFTVLVPILFRAFFVNVTIASIAKYVTAFVSKSGSVLGVLLSSNTFTASQQPRTRAAPLSNALRLCFIWLLDPRVRPLLFSATGGRHASGSLSQEAQVELLFFLEAMENVDPFSSVPCTKYWQERALGRACPGDTWLHLLQPLATELNLHHLRSVSHKHVSRDASGVTPLPASRARVCEWAKRCTCKYIEYSQKGHPHPQQQGRRCGICQQQVNHYPPNCWKPSLSWVGSRAVAFRNASYVAVLQQQQLFSLQITTPPFNSSLPFLFSPVFSFPTFPQQASALTELCRKARRNPSSPPWAMGDHSSRILFHIILTFLS